ncbi:chaperone protein DnaJ [Angomonas deanei]|nr:chaperone protein DnaJ [Angomonas deanei]|eukprot:EPY36322.1 chaperone protein DnaJ [Angomonas deanei]
MVRQFHPAANSIRVEFSQFDIILKSVTPCFVPCYVIKANYDEQEYHLFVSGLTGKVVGPYFIHAHDTGRAIALVAFVFLLFLFAFLGGDTLVIMFCAFLLAVVTYFIAFCVAKCIPQLDRDSLRAKQDGLREKHWANDAGGYRPDIHSELRTEEYHFSTYETRKMDGHPTINHNSSRNNIHNPHTKDNTSSCGCSRPIIRDPKQYYRTLGLNGDEPVEEIHVAYYKLISDNHPLTAHWTADTKQAKEAYRVLRDAKQREAYDRSD